MGAHSFDFSCRPIALAIIRKCRIKDTDLLSFCLGADGFRFVVEWEKILLLIPALALLTVVLAVRLGISEIKKVKAFECCMRKE